MEHERRQISLREFLTILLLFVQLVMFSFWLGSLNQKVGDINFRLDRLERIVLKVTN